MSYDVKCRTCDALTRPGNIIDLLKEHTNQSGRFVCSKCSGTDTFIYRISDLQEGPEEKWKRWIKGVISIDSGIETYSPYVFLTADSEVDGSVTGLHFHYDKDTRAQPAAVSSTAMGLAARPSWEAMTSFTFWSTSLPRASCRKSACAILP